MRSMALANAGGRTGERDPIPEGERRADRSRREAQRGGRAEAGVEPATRRHTKLARLVTKSTMPLYGKGRRRKNSPATKANGSHFVGICQKSRKRKKKKKKDNKQVHLTSNTPQQFDRHSLRVLDAIFHATTRGRETSPSGCCGAVPRYFRSIFFRLFRWGQWFFGSVGFFPLRFQEIQKF